MQTDSRPVPPTFTWLTLLGSFALGIVVGAVGTVMHRSMRPWGLVICLVLVASGALVARAWGGLRAWIGYVVAATATVWLLSTQGPGGDVLVPAHQAIGWVWIFGVPVVAIVVALLPAALFDDRPRPPRGGAQQRGGQPGPADAGVGQDRVGQLAAPVWPPAPGSADPTGPASAEPKGPASVEPTGSDSPGLAGPASVEPTGPDSPGLAGPGRGPGSGA